MSMLMQIQVVWKYLMTVVDRFGFTIHALLLTTKKIPRTK